MKVFRPSPGFCCCARYTENARITSARYAELYCVGGIGKYGRGTERDISGGHPF
jgi:hypothetical protein